MENTFFRTEVKTDFKDSLVSVIEVLEILAVTPEQRAVLAPVKVKLEEKFGISSTTEQQQIQQFAFKVPESTFATLVTDLGAVRPKIGLHFINHNGLLKRNMTPASYDIRNPEERAQRVRDDLFVANNEAADAVLLAAYNNELVTSRNHNRAAEQIVPVFALMQREEPNDVRNKDAQLVFVDTQHKNPDWHYVVQNLKNFGEPLGYNLDHYKRALNRFIGYFSPSLKTVTDELDANELAQFLMQLTMPVPKFEKLAQQIQSLTRKANKSLQIVLSTLHGLGKAYYSKRTDKEQLINKLMITGLIAFTAGPTQKALVHAIDMLQTQGKVPDWNNLFQSVLQAERSYGQPQTTIAFKAQIEPQAAFFNTACLPIEETVQTSFTPVQPSLMPQFLFDDCTDYRQQKAPSGSSIKPVGTPVKGITPQAVHQPHVEPPAQQQAQEIQPQQAAQQHNNGARPRNRSANRQQRARPHSQELRRSERLKKKTVSP
jgi:hypothetical protein